MDVGVLPRVIRTLVERRAVVKKMLKKEKVLTLFSLVFIVFTQVVPALKNLLFV